MISTFVFYALLLVIALTAIPYGTVQPWWKAVFQCAVFLLAALSVIGLFISSDRRREKYRFWRRVFWPVFAFLAFALLQTVSLPSFLHSGIDQRTTISADVFTTQQWIVQVLALSLVSWLVVTHANSAKRRQRVIDVVIAIGAASAFFGLLRQTFQRSLGFVLPDLRAGYGYAQFINANHFAFLMELALALALGMVVCGGVKKRRAAIYILAALPMWLAIVLSGSRGGILSLLCQVLLLAFLFSLWRSAPAREERPASFSNRVRRAGSTFLVRGVLVIGVLTAAVTTVVLVGGDPLAGRVDSLAVELDRNVADVYTLRPNIWRASWALVKDHPVAGVGFGGYWIAITKYHVGSGETTPQEAHNDYLELLASGGVIGVILGLWLIVQLFRAAKSKLSELSGQVRDPDTSFERAATLAALIGMLTVAVHSLVDFGLHITVNAVVFAVLMAIVCVRAEAGDQEAGAWAGHERH